MYNNPISLGKIITSSINIINSIKKIIPIYDDVKPLINKLGNLSQTLKKAQLSDININKNLQKKEELTIYSSPQFFL